MVELLTLLEHSLNDANVFLLIDRAAGVDVAKAMIRIV